MKLLTQITAFVLLALWLPAAQHCNLEASGWLSQVIPATDCCESTALCAEDNCDWAEGHVIRPAASVAQVSADFTLCLSLLDLHLPPTALAKTSILTVAATERPVDWLASWQFSRRLAPPARAPNSCA